MITVEELNEKHRNVLDMVRAAVPVNDPIRFAALNDAITDLRIAAYNAGADMARDVWRDCK